MLLEILPTKGQQGSTTSNVAFQQGRKNSFVKEDCVAHDLFLDLCRRMIDCSADFKNL